MQTLLTWRKPKIELKGHVAVDSIVYKIIHVLFSDGVQSSSPIESIGYTTGASFQLFLGGQIFLLFFNATRLLKNWKKEHFIPM